jgi:PAS domain S-box-containing protein
MPTIKPAQQPALAALLIFFVVVSLFIGLEILEQQRFRETLQTRTINTLSRIRADLEAEINANFYLTRGLIAYIATHPDINEDIFYRLAEQILQNHNYIRNIALAPNNIIRFVYPLQGNERAIGLNYQNNAEQWPAVAKIVESGKTVIAGPVTLVQGGTAFVSRTPVFLTNHGNPSQEDSYWGLASVVIEQDRLFTAAGIYTPDLNIRFAIKGKDGLGAEGDMIDGDPAIFLDRPILLPVNLPEGSWLLAAVPKEGWRLASPYLMPLRIAALVIASFIGLAVYTWLRRQERNRRSLETAWREARQAQSDLRLNEEFLNTVFDNIPAMLFIKDAQELRFVRFNKTGADMLGYSVSDFLGKNDFDFFEETQARTFTDKDREVLNKGILIDIPEESIATKDGRKKILHTRKIPLFDLDGRPRHLLGISEDITEQILAKAEKEHLEKMLQQSHKLETIGKMAGGVAHDLNNILSGIINYPELLLLQLPSDSPLRKPLSQIHDSGKRAARVVADLLTIARGVAAVKETTCLNDLVREHLESPEHRKLCTAFPHISFETKLASDVRMVSSSRVHIQKCLMNLLNNGAEAFPADTAGSIRITTRNIELHQTLPGFADIEVGSYVVLAVADNGPGILTDDLDHIFEPFYTRKAMGRSGTGLGLTVVWNTMQDHRGAVTADNNTDSGTTFSLYFPAIEEKISPPATSVALTDLCGQGQHILIVDDEPQQRDIATQILRNLNYSPQAVASGEEAISYLKSHAADLVILDMIMPPGLNGRQTYETILASHPGQKAIIASGFADGEEVARLQALGAGKLVKKPYTIEELGGSVQLALKTNE